MWEGLGPSMEVGHYHSWVVEEDSLPAGWHVNARSSQGVPMAIGHESFRCGRPISSGVRLDAQGRDLLRGWGEAAQRCLAISASNVSLNFS